MDNAVTIVALLVIAAVACLAVFHPSFEDTLVQRISLAGICIGALSGAYTATKEVIPSGLEVAAIAAAVYALECGRIVKKRWKKHVTTNAVS